MTPALCNFIGRLVAPGARSDTCFILFFQNVVCQRLGSRIPSAGRDFHSVLDRDPLGRASPVAGQGSHSDGVAVQPHHLGVLTKVSCWSHPLLVSLKTSQLHTNPRVFRCLSAAIIYIFGYIRVPWHCYVYTPFLSHIHFKNEVFRKPSLYTISFLSASQPFCCFHTF